jgi:hypothetical protein
MPPRSRDRCLLLHFVPNSEARQLDDSIFDLRNFLDLTLCITFQLLGLFWRICLGCTTPHMVALCDRQINKPALKVGRGLGTTTVDQPPRFKLKFGGKG